MITVLATLLALQAPAQVTDLNWLAGRWEASTGERWTEENWAPARGGAILGHSRSGRGEALREFEFLRLQADSEGVPTYYAQPGGRPPVGFRLVTREGTSATFENPGHDFPQRIRYVRTGETLVATISAIDGANATSWTFRRVRDDRGQDQAD